MASILTKVQRELRTFEALAPLVGITVVTGSIIQAPPPAPDIQCNVVGVGRMNFELVAIDGEDTRTRLANMHNTQEAWDRALSRLSAADQFRVQVAFADAHLSLNFDEGSGMRVRSAALESIQKRSLSLPSGYDGPVFDYSTLPKGLYGATIYRIGVTTGPHFMTPSVGEWLPPQLGKIEEKLRDKRYVFTGPLELFAYSTHDEPGGHINSLDEIQACITRHLAGSSFMRVHVFHLGFLKHIVTVP